MRRMKGGLSHDLHRPEPQPRFRFFGFIFHPEPSFYSSTALLKCFLGQMFSGANVCFDNCELAKMTEN